MIDKYCKTTTSENGKGNITIIKIKKDFTEALIMDESGHEETINQEVLNNVLMYEIIKKLSSIEKILSDQLPLGKILGIPNGLSITSGDTYVDFVTGYVVFPDNTRKSIPTYHRGLFSISIENEGTGGCNITINPNESWGYRPVDSGETFNIDLKRPSITQMKISSTSTCTLQISGVI